MSRLFVYFYIKIWESFPHTRGAGRLDTSYIRGIKPSFLEERLLSWHDDTAHQLIHLVLIIPVCAGVGAE